MREPNYKRKPLTPRELEVLTLAFYGRGIKNTARALYIAESTVKFHRHRIMVKLDAPNMMAAVGAAIRSGVLA